MAGKVIGITLVAVLTALFFTNSSAQSDDCDSVIVDLAPCVTYITGDVECPTDECCKNLAGVIENHPRCLFGLINGGAEKYGIKINVTQALALPVLCVTKNLPFSKCHGSGASPPSAPPSSPPVTPSPPAIPPSTPTTPPAITPSAPPTPSAIPPSTPTTPPALPPSPSTPATPPATPPSALRTRSTLSVLNTPSSTAPSTPSTPSTPSVPSGQSSTGSSNKSSPSLMSVLFFIAACVSSLTAL